MTQEIEETRQEIDEMYRRIEEATYYELLDIDPELDDAQVADQVTDKFRQLAKKWHVDRYDTEALGGPEYHEKLQEIFAHGFIIVTV